MNWVDRSLNRVQKVLTLGPASPPPEPEQVPDVPGRRPPLDARRAVVAVATAIVLPVAFGLVFLPLRDELSQSMSLVMVIPVLVVALLGGAKLATVAALSAACVFDVLYTEPYYRPKIDDTDDIVETIVLLVIGVTIGVLAQSAQRAVIASRIRRRELAAVTEFVEHIGTRISAADLAAHAGASITDLLDATTCEWLPDYKGTASPVLRPDGSLTSELGEVEARAAGVLPTTIEIPIGEPPSDHGRFIVRTDGRTSISMEERRAAATIANTLGRCLGP
jgi:K+-sensing histidine kinase KdpD